MFGIISFKFSTHKNSGIKIKIWFFKNTIDQKLQFYRKVIL